ncbi:MAG: hypothetical protein Q4C98_11490, partial [Capnocytophaga sp.]|nr:hypothetical protein [Capnocytophaga sp.]
MKTFKLLLVSVIVFLAGCQKDNNKVLEEETLKISLEEAKTYFEFQEKEKRAKENTFSLNPDWNTFTQGVDDNQEDYACVEALANGISSTLLFTKTEGIRFKVLYPHLYEEQLRLLVFDEMGNVQEAHYIPNEEDMEERKTSYRMSLPGYGECAWCGYNVPLFATYTSDGVVWHWPKTCSILACSFCCSLWEGVVVTGYKNQNKNDPSALGILPNRYQEQIDKVRDFFSIPRNNFIRAGGGKYSSSTTKVDDTKLTNPCAKSILKSMRDKLKMKNFLTENKLAGGRHNFSEMILNLFEKSTQTHLTFQNASLGNKNGSTSLDGRTITLGDNYLKTATQLAIARTIIHEMVHAYLVAIYRRYSGFENKSLQDLLKYF